MIIRGYLQKGFCAKISQERLLEKNVAVSFSKFNPRSSIHFDFPNMNWGQDMFEMWKQSMGSSDILSNVQSATQKMFEIIEQTVQQNWSSNPFMKQAEEATRKNKTLFPNGCDPAYYQTMVEINKIAMAMMQSIMQLQQQYLCQVFQKVGQGMAKNSKGRSTTNQYDYARAEEEDLSQQTAKCFSTIFGIMKQANQDIYQKFMHITPESDFNREEPNFNREEPNFSPKEEPSDHDEKEAKATVKTDDEQEPEAADLQQKKQAPKASKKKSHPHED